MVESTIMSCCTITCSTTARFMAKWVFDGEAQGSFVTRKYVGVVFLSGWGVNDEKIDEEINLGC